MKTTQTTRVATNAVGYLRVSTARDDMHAPEMYQEQISGYATGKHLKLGRVYADVDFSGRKGARLARSSTRCWTMRTQVGSTC